LCFKKSEVEEILTTKKGVWLCQINI
jgi:hypothetical protein